MFSFKSTTNEEKIRMIKKVESIKNNSTDRGNHILTLDEYNNIINVIDPLSGDVYNFENNIVDFQIATLQDVANKLAEYTGRFENIQEKTKKKMLSTTEKTIDEVLNNVVILDDYVDACKRLEVYNSRLDALACKNDQELYKYFEGEELEYSAVTCDMLMDHINKFECFN